MSFVHIWTTHTLFTKMFLFPITVMTKWEITPNNELGRAAGDEKAIALHGGIYTLMCSTRYISRRRRGSEENQHQNSRQKVLIFG
jgi:hypothetical protein